MFAIKIFIKRNLTPKKIEKELLLSLTIRLTDLDDIKFIRSDLNLSLLCLILILEY